MPVLKFDKPIYKASAVRAAVKDFSGFASFSVENRRDSIIVTINDMAPEVKQHFASEFCNYVIGMMK